MKRVVAVTLLSAVAAGNAAAAGNINGVAGEVPPDYAEICALRADIPSAARRNNGDAPDTFVRFLYGRREFKTPTEDDTLNPNWGQSGCTTLPALNTSDSKHTFKVELWDEQSRSYDPAGLVYDDVLLAEDTTSPDPKKKWLTLKGTIEARVYVQIIANVPGADNGSPSATDGGAFESLTSWGAFFIYVGCAVAVVILLVCCFFGKGRRVERKDPPIEDEGEFDGRVSQDLEVAAAARAPPVQPLSRAGEEFSSSRSRPQLTVDVSTPPAVREMTVVAVQNQPSAQSRASRA